SKEVPAGTSTLPVGKAIRSTVGAIDPVARSSCLRYSCMIVVGAGGSSSADRVLGRLAPQVKQMRSSCLTSAPQAGQVKVTMMAPGQLSGLGRFWARTRA